MSEGREVLQKELHALRAHIASLQSSLEDKPEYGLGKGDPSVTRWELDRALLQQLTEQAASIERALSTTAEGRYGLCEKCGAPIHPDRLAVLPDTRVCIDCASIGGRR